MTKPPSATLPSPSLPGPTSARPASRRRGRVRFVLLGALALALVAYGAWTWRARSRAAQASAAAASKAASDRVVPVLTASVTQRDVPIWLEGLGSVVAFSTVTVRPQVDGRLEKVLFTEGQRVTKGDVLAQIDARPFAIQLRTAQAALARDVATFKNGELNQERYKTLSAQHLIAEQQLTDQEATVGQLAAQVHGDEAQVAAARLNLDYARITSPIDGVTGIRLVDPGNIVHASDATGLVVVAQLDPIAVLFTLPEDDLPAISRAMSDPTADPGNPATGRVPKQEIAVAVDHEGPELAVEARSRDGDRRLGRGKLTVIDNQINQATATVRLKAIFSNPQQALWPNQFVKARLRLTTRQGAIVVPAAVIQRGPQGAFAYVVGNDSVATVRPVVVESMEGELAILSSGLSPGEQVVVEGQAQLRPGSKVAPKSAPSASAAESAPPNEASP